jgi:hypothetical protein
MKTAKEFSEIAFGALSIMIIVINTILYPGTNVLKWILIPESIFPIIFFTVIVIIEVRNWGSYKGIRQLYRRAILILFTVVVLVNYLIWKDSIFINSLLISLIAFSPAFLSTFLIKGKEQNENIEITLKEMTLITDLSLERFMSVGLFIFTSLIMIALGCEASKNIYIFSADEMVLKIVLCACLVGQLITIIWINLSDDMEHFIKWIRLGIIFFFLCYLGLSWFWFKPELRDLFLVGLIFFPGFIFTFLNILIFNFKKKTEKNKSKLAKNGYDTKNPITIDDNGDMLLKKKISPEYFLTVEVDKHYNIIMYHECSMGHKH